jgi:hypothetical protein
MDVVPLIVAVSVVLSFGGYSVYKTVNRYNYIQDALSQPAVFPTGPSKVSYAQAQQAALQ